MQRSFTALAATVFGLALPCAAAMAAPTQYMATFTELNNSGVSGTATLSVDTDANLLTVMIDATGLEPNQVHLQHIHGFLASGQNAVTPPVSAAGPDGVLSVADGIPFYGPIILPLDPPPTAPTGAINYSRTFTDAEVNELGEMAVPMLPAGAVTPATGVDELMPLDVRELVIHGMTINGTYDVTVPVASAEIVPMSAAAVPLPPAVWMGLATMGFAGVTAARQRLVRA